MTPHTIRLRGGWLVAPLEPADGPAARLELPTRWEGAGEIALRLARGFQRPPIDPAAEWVELRVRDAPGVIGIWLNGERLTAEPEGSPAGLSFRLPSSLPARNELVLHVIPQRGPASPRSPGPWGDIALVIHPVGAGVAGT